MIKITSSITLPESDIKLTFIRSPGPGGQNVNKVATAVLLRFNALHSTALPNEVRKRLIFLAGNKITLLGDLIIKATQYRTQERNKQAALDRLKKLIQHAASIPKKRKKTKPTYTSMQKRLAVKKLHAKTKSLRGKKISYD